MREMIFRIGLLFFCLTIIACIGMGVSLESTLIRSTIVFFFFISIVYVFMFVFSKSEENEMKVKTRLVDELLNDNNFEIINDRIEERARFLLEEQQRIEEDDEHIDNIKE